MARTTRTILSYDADRDVLAPAEVRDGLRPGYGRARHFHGGMAMSPRPSGIWDDMRPASGRDRDAQRRLAKRREARRVMADVLDLGTEVPSDALPLWERPTPEPALDVIHHDLDRYMQEVYDSDDAWLYPSKDAEVEACWNSLRFEREVLGSDV